MDAHQTITCVMPFFVSVISWVKMLRNKKNTYIREDHEYIEKKMENLQLDINKNKLSIFNISNQIEYIDEAIVNININNKMAKTKTNMDIDKSLTDFEILINEKLYTFEQRIRKIENKSVNMTENITENMTENMHLKIINPELFIKNDMYCYDKQCPPPYNIIHTSSSTHASSTISPEKNNEWISLPSTQYRFD